MNDPGMTMNYPMKSVLWFVFIYPGNGSARAFWNLYYLLHDLVF